MLTDTAARNARAKDKDYKLADSGGLYLFVTTKGHKSWRFKYRFGGKEKRLVFGSYPEVSLAEARNRRDDARRLVREHRDPSAEAKKDKLASIVRHENTLEKFARSWHATQKDRWKPVHAADVINSLERDIFPSLGAMPITDIDKPTLKAVLQMVEKRGAIETAHRLLQRMSAVFEYAEGEGGGNGNPAAGLKGSLKPAPRSVAGRRSPTSRSSAS